MDQELNKINERLDKLTDFITNKLVTKEELAEQLGELRADLPTKADFTNLQKSVDAIAKGFKDSEQELQIVGERTTRMESWIRKAADKIGVPYKP